MMQMILVKGHICISLTGSFANLGLRTVMKLLDELLSLRLGQPALLESNKCYEGRVANYVQ
jgi:hypothetical protein